MPVLALGCAGPEGCPEALGQAGKRRARGLWSGRGQAGRMAPWRPRLSRPAVPASAYRRSSMPTQKGVTQPSSSSMAARLCVTVGGVAAAGRVREVFEAAEEVGYYARRNSPDRRVHYSTLPLGTGHSWQIAEHETRTYDAGQRVERIAGPSMAARPAEGSINLQRSPLWP